uniref:Uncharacterized protein n=1 Tax=Arundo donax TaxID=35708 RepID=A0A0A9E5A1_ARUDO
MVSYHKKFTALGYHVLIYRYRANHLIRFLGNVKYEQFIEFKQKTHWGY